MKTNFKSKLFEKQIDLESHKEIMGGSTGCSNSDYSYSGACVVDSTTTTYSENGSIISIDRCSYTCP